MMAEVNSVFECSRHYTRFLLVAHGLYSWCMTFACSVLRLRPALRLKSRFLLARRTSCSDRFASARPRYCADVRMGPPGHVGGHAEARARHRR